MHSVDIDGVLPGVRRMAYHTPIAPNGVSDAEDMEQDATVGVLQAARSFEPERGNRFATHAYLRARGALLDGQRALDHVSRSWRDAQRNVLRARTAMVAELLREPSQEELANRLEISTQELRDIEERCLPPAPLAETLQAQSAKGEELTVDDVLRAEGPLPEDLVLARENAAKLHTAISLLPRREEFTIRATWFLDLTAIEVAELLGVSPSRVSQIRSEAMERLRGITPELRDAA
jgi:RNA polymerase sigma factor for flagellar operon FliA